jgi:hypothetical protein
VQTRTAVWEVDQRAARKSFLTLNKSINFMFLIEIAKKLALEESVL